MPGEPPTTSTGLLHRVTLQSALACSYSSLNSGLAGKESTSHLNVRDTALQRDCPFLALSPSQPLLIFPRVFQDRDTGEGNRSAYQVEDPTTTSQ